MSLVSICDPNPATVPLDASAGDAIRLMLEQRVGGVVVVDSERVVAGVFTERDVLKKLALGGRDPAAVPIREVMTTPVEMATEETSYAEALSVMLERHYRHLPIVDGQGRLLGILSIRDLLQSRIDDLLAQLEAAKQPRQRVV
jgi:CBS domain-containing protein